MRKFLLFLVVFMSVTLNSCGVSVHAYDEIYDYESTIILDNGDVSIVYYFDERWPNYYWYFDREVSMWRWHYFTHPPRVWHHWPHHKPFFGYRTPSIPRHHMHNSHIQHRYPVPQYRNNRSENWNRNHSARPHVQQGNMNHNRPQGNHNRGMRRH